MIQPAKIWSHIQVTQVKKVNVAEESTYSMQTKVATIGPNMNYGHQKHKHRTCDKINMAI
jgi:hypothetical protein